VKLPASMARALPRARRWGRWGLRWALRGLTVFTVFTVLQVLFVRFVDPPFTATMVQRVVERTWRGEGHAWVDHRSVPLEAMGPFPRAAVASEDGRFFFHHGFDLQGICAALEANREGRALRGGSTISQQVARNVFLVQWRSWIRKGLEVWYTAWLELLVPKERILELYGNVAETGPHHFGVEAAARHWYGRSAKALSPEQAARLVYLLPNPRERRPDSRSGGEKARWVDRNRVPFPGDPGFDRAQQVWDAQATPWRCFLP
jgi:monofunctional biosynthetic peptidoglycan transglycosylase